MSYIEKLYLAILRSKYGQHARLPAHDKAVCGIDWDSTCIDCLRTWENHKRQSDLPRELQTALEFKVIRERRPEPKKPYKVKP